MNDTYQLRAATVHDIETLIHHRYAMWRDMGRDPKLLEIMVPAAREYFSKAVPDASYRGWLAEGEGKIVGGAGVVISPWPGNPGSTLAKRAMILNMYVEPEHRRQGIAGTLMTAMIEWCKAEGFTSVGLHASDKGRALYASMGFEATNEMRLTL
ncbi:MAG TPA: GNAT family N-acetyltransferase [Candidatus Koribacter sp.]|jgi:GNAT superfamily N-acetyltransferase